MSVITTKIITKTVRIITLSNFMNDHNSVDMIQKIVVEIHPCAKTLIAMCLQAPMVMMKMKNQVPI